MLIYAKWLFILKIKSDIIKTIYKGGEWILARVGLVLEGGAMRGMFTAGVLDVFMENNIKVTDIVGVSAGTLLTPCFKTT